MTIRRPSGLMRLFVKSPLIFYRMGLGGLLGTRFVQITHRGRKSGLLRQTVVEVLRYDRHTREVIVVSAWAGKTDWYRNLQQEPAREIRIGRAVYQPDQQFLSPEETSTEVLAMLRRHPLEAHILARFLGLGLNADASTLRTKIETALRGVRFCPTQEA